MITAVDIDSMIGMLGTLINGFTSLFDYFFYSLNDFISFLGVNVAIPAWAGGDLTPFSIMIGVMLPAYIAYQFVTWVLNLVT